MNSHWNFNFELILFWAVVISGIIVLIDMLFFAPKRKRKKQENIPAVFDFFRSIFPILVIVFFIRSFLYEAYRIPSGSLEPTLLPGDLILVNKYDYGIRLPVIHKKIIATHEPQRGDIVVFLWPPKPSIYFIKRLIGLPGDHISYINKVLYVNGQKMSQSFQQNGTDDDDEGHQWQIVQNDENFFGVKHSIYLIPEKVSYDFKDIIVPKDMYFMMGDNRDASDDSRFWGFVPDKNLVGKAVLVLTSWNNQVSWLALYHKFRWDRTFVPINKKQNDLTHDKDATATNRVKTI